MAMPITTLIPIPELTPGAVGSIRNQVINAVVKTAATELGLPQDKLVVRDVRPVGDLQMYAGGTTDATVEDWIYDSSTITASAYNTVTGDKTMGDNRFVALFGVRDLRGTLTIHATGAGGTSNYYEMFSMASVVSQIKVAVGGSDKVIWDIESIQPYKNQMVGFTNSPVIIPQNTLFNIKYYYNGAQCPGSRVNLQLIGVTVEPRGKVIAP